MAESIFLKIKAEKLGTISEVREFLNDLESAYNSIYIFDLLVDIIFGINERRNKELNDRYSLFRQYSKEYMLKKEYLSDPILYDLYIRDYYLRQYHIMPNLAEIYSSLKADDIILPNEQLIISKINIQSPGFWEFLGSLNPLSQIREYLKDCHERKKDNQYRNRIEQQKGDLDILEKQNNILKQRIEILKGAGYSDEEIRPLIISSIIKPLQRLNAHQNSGLIEGPED